MSFSDLICIFAMSIVEFSFLFCNTKISEFFDMAKSWAARLCRLPKQELFVAQELINKVKSKCCGIKGNRYAAVIIYILIRVSNPVVLTCYEEV